MHHFFGCDPSVDGADISVLCQEPARILLRSEVHHLLCAGYGADCAGMPDVPGSPQKSEETAAAGGMITLHMK